VGGPEGPERRRRARRVEGGARVRRQDRDPVGRRAREGEGLGAIPGLAGMPGIDPSALMGQVEPMLERMSGTMFGVQVGQAVGALAGSLVSGTDVGLPLVPGHGVALMPANIATFAEGLEVDLAEVRLYLAVREAARVRLFAEVPWLGPQLIAAVQAYARDISIDTEGIELALQSTDTSDPAAMQVALSSSVRKAIRRA